MTVLRFSARELSIILHSIALLLTPLNAQPSSISPEDLRKLLKNPISQKTSLGYTNEFDFGSGSGTSYFGTFQPIVPFTAGPISFINRPAFTFARIPLQPTGPTSAGIGQKASGIGDLSYQLFLTPAKARTIIWGFGPAFIFPTATRDAFGNGKWSAGPTAAIVVQPGRLSLATGVTHVWSYAGDKRRAPTSLLTVEVVFDYALGRGWSLSSDPVLTDDWRGAAGERWLVPLGGGVSKSFNGRVPLQFSVLAYRNVIRQSFSPSWSLQFVVTPVLGFK